MNLTTRSTNRQVRRPDLNRLAKAFAQAVSTHQYRKFSLQLNTTEEVLRRLGVGVATADELSRHGGWAQGWSDDANCLMVIPERDADLNVVGLSLRDEAGRPGGIGQRGLTVPVDISDSPDPVLVVDGIHDVAACLTLGLTAIGCPVKKRAIADLGRLVEGREAIVIGSSGPNAWRLQALAGLGLDVTPVSRRNADPG